ncbi:hypothetical protein FQZ97_916870 [compost metagenome]
MQGRCSPDEIRGEVRTAPPGFHPGYDLPACIRDNDTALTRLAQRLRPRVRMIHSCPGGVHVQPQLPSPSTPCRRLHRRSSAGPGSLQRPGCLRAGQRQGAGASAAVEPNRACTAARAGNARRSRLPGQARRLFRRGAADAADGPRTHGRCAAAGLPRYPPRAISASGRQSGACGGQCTGLHLQHRCRYRQLRQRAALSQRGPATAG